MSELELQDAIIRHALELQRLSAHEEAQALQILAELEAELRQLLATQDLTEAGKREVEALIKSAEKAIDTRYSDISAQVNVRELVLVVADKTVQTMAEAFPRASLPTAERLASLSKDILIDGSPASAWWQRQSEDLQFKFAAQVRQGVLNGEAQEQIVARIVGRGDEIGIMDAARRNVRQLVHSSIMTAANRARLETFRKNSAHVAGVKWLATLDSHTCLTCAALDGSQWDLDGEPMKGTKLDFQAPPAHFACRCVLTPVAKSLDDIFPGLDAKIAETATRASMNGPTKATTFAAFLDRQSASFVAETLGAKRAELYRAGKITLTDLVSGSGRPLTLDELKAR